MSHISFDDQLPNANVKYFEKFMTDNMRDKIYDDLTNLFKMDCNGPKFVIKEDGSKYKLSRRTLVFVSVDIDKSIIPKIWGDNVTIMDFTDDLNQLKALIEKETNFKFNICLANYYSTGKKSIHFHSDKEEKGSTSCIASISMGAERPFIFRKITEREPCFTLNLANGSLLIMGDGCQENYEHSLPQDKTCHDPRLNLTFRLFDEKRYITH
jgi:hypothetical protein